jgi:hypothetical protein
MQLDLEFIRQNFPAFDVPSFAGAIIFRKCWGLLHLRASSGSSGPLLPGA